MKKASIALGLALLASAATANAEIVTFEYTAKIIGLEQRGIWSPVGEQVQSSDWAGFVINTGETITGRLSYDTSTQLVRDLDYPWGYVYKSVSPANITHSFTMQGSGTSLSVDATAGVTLADSPESGDGLTFTGNAGGSDWSETSFSLAAVRPGYQPAVLPGAGELSEVGGTRGFTADSFTITFWNPGYYVAAASTITSFHVVSSVPEPSTYAMLLAGAVPLLLRRRKA